MVRFFYFYYLILSNYNCRIHCNFLLRYLCHRCCQCCHRFGCPICCCSRTRWDAYNPGMESPFRNCLMKSLRNLQTDRLRRMKPKILFYSLCHRNGIAPTMLHSLRLHREVSAFNDIEREKKMQFSFVDLNWIQFFQEFKLILIF